MSRNLPCHRPVIAAALCCAVTAQAATGADARKQVFAVPSGDATSTLAEFARSSGKQIAYMVENVRGVSTQPVRGEWVAIDALRQMLTGTTLFAVQDEATGAIVVSRRRPAPESGDSGSTDSNAGQTRATPPTDRSSDQAPATPPKTPPASSVKPRSLLSVLATFLASEPAAAQTAPTPPK